MHKKMLVDCTTLRKHFSFEEKYGMEQLFGDMKKFKEEYEVGSTSLVGAFLKFILIN